MRTLEQFREHIEELAKTGVFELDRPPRVIHNPAPGRTLRDWAIDRTMMGHAPACPNYSKLNERPCDCGYLMAWEQCFNMLPMAKPHEPDMSEL